MTNVTFQTLRYTTEDTFFFCFSVSLGDFSDTSIDENSLKKTINDFQISDDEENNSPKLSFLKTKKSNSDSMEEEPGFSNKKDEEMAPGNYEDRVVNPLSESQNEDQETEKEKLQMKPKPRILPIKNTASGNLLDHYNCIS